MNATGKIMLRFNTSYYRELCRAACPKWDDKSDKAGQRYHEELIQHMNRGDDEDDDTHTGVDFSDMADLWEFLRRVFASGLTMSQLSPALYIDIVGDGARADLGANTMIGYKGEVTANVRLDRGKVNTMTVELVTTAHDALSKILSL